MSGETREKLGYMGVSLGALAVFMAGYAWIEGHEWPRITETWTAILGGVGVGLGLVGLLLSWPRG